jgi:hypothetical protein
MCTPHIILCIGKHYFHSKLLNIITYFCNLNAMLV